MLTFAPRLTAAGFMCDVFWNQMLVRSSYQVAPKPTEKRQQIIELGKNLKGG
jgi:cystathionine beta-lyase family protein involved in aluminum resistance